MPQAIRLSIRGFSALVAGNEALLFGRASGTYFRLAPAAAIVRPDLYELPLQRAVDLAVKSTYSTLPKSTRVPILPAHVLTCFGPMATSRKRPRLDASLARTPNGPLLVCGGPGAGKSTLVRLFDEVAGARGEDVPFRIGYEKSHPPSAIWLIDAARRRGEGFTLARLPPVAAAVRLLEHVAGPATPAAWMLAFDFAVRLSSLPCYEVTLPGELGALRTAVRNFVSL